MAFDPALLSNPAFLSALANYVQGNPNPVVTPGSQAASGSTLTGIKNSELESQLFGKAIPIFVGGQALIGARIAEGPFLETIGDVNVVSFIAHAAAAATPSATRTITSVRLNGTESWNSTDGVLGGATFGDMAINVKTGTEDQTPFDSSISRFGDYAVPYRPGIMVEVSECPLSLFNNEIPFASLYVYEADNITRTDAIKALLRYARFTDDEFDIDVSGTDQFWIVSQNTGLFDFLRGMQSVFRRWNIVASDKLYISESDFTNTDVNITRDDIQVNSLQALRGDPLALERQRALRFIDTARDNDFNTVQGRLERFPEPLTSSQNTSTYELPIGMTQEAAQILVDDALSIDDLARKGISAAGMFSMIGLQPGQIIKLNNTVLGFRGRVTETVFNHDFTVDFKAEQVSPIVLANPVEDEDENEDESDDGFVTTFLSHLQY